MLRATFYEADKPIQGGGQRLLGDRLFQVGHSADLQRALGLISNRNDVDGDVASVGIVLQQVEHSPAIELRQHDIQCNRIRLVLPREGQAGVAALSNQDLEAAIVGGVDQNPIEADVVVD